ncbi:MAG: carboxyltransferase domain-containing protein, partial [Trueperaceae bacterium]|nr:carboxyltransferase domain-containing protein [Trueperaceae bacterium]
MHPRRQPGVGRDRGGGAGCARRFRRQGGRVLTTVLGGRYLYLRFPGEVGRSLSGEIHAVARGLVSSGTPGLLDVVPGYDTLLVEFDPSLIGAAAVRRAVAASRDGTSGEGTARTVRLDTVYDGPDLDEVARRAGLSVPEVVRRHAARDYFVYAVGFTPGFPFMG